MMPTEVEMLIAEDNPADEELILISLKGSPVAERIHVVRDGEETLDFLFCRKGYEERVSLSPPRMVLLDLKLPKLDGIEVLRAVRTDPRTRNIPVVMLSSSNVQRDVRSAYEVGVNSYIQKPVDYARFRDVVKAVGEYWLTLNEPVPTAAADGYSH